MRGVSEGWSSFMMALDISASLSSYYPPPCVYWKCTQIWTTWTLNVCDVVRMNLFWWSS